MPRTKSSITPDTNGDEYDADRFWYTSTDDDTGERTGYLYLVGCMLWPGGGQPGDIRDDVIGLGREATLLSRQ